MNELKVELYGHPIGSLTATRADVFDFQTDDTTFEYFQLGSTILSESVPLLAVTRQGGRLRRQNYFTELLPEGRTLKNLADSIGAREDDAITLLSHFGRDVAGAVQIYDPTQPGEPRTPRTNKVTDGEISNLLKDTRGTPLGNKPLRGKTSLAGVQDKIVLAKIEGDWHQVLDGYPSTHILKPPSQEYPTTIFDEEYGSRLARAVGLVEYSTEFEDFNGLVALVIERFDRTNSFPPGRIHQEDMNQALGARSNQKYQEFGGLVSLRRIAEIFQKNGDLDSLTRLLKLNTLAVAIGNVDLHAKNISMLHFTNGDSSLAPAYDTVPLIHNPDSDKRMALAINGKYIHGQISSLDIIEEAKSWGMRNPDSLVTETLDNILAAVRTEQPDFRASRDLNLMIRTFTENLLNGNSAA